MPVIRFYWLISIFEVCLYGLFSCSARKVSAQIQVFIVSLRLTTLWLSFLFHQFIVDKLRVFIGVFDFRGVKSGKLKEVFNIFSCKGA